MIIQKAKLILEKKQKEIDEQDKRNKEYDDEYWCMRDGVCPHCASTDVRDTSWMQFGGKFKCKKCKLVRKNTGMF